MEVVVMQGSAPGPSTVEKCSQAPTKTSRRKFCSSGEPRQPSFTVTTRLSFSRKEKTSTALPKACSEVRLVLVPLFMERQE